MLLNDDLEVILKMLVYTSSKKIININILVSIKKPVWRNTKNHILLSKIWKKK